MEKNYEHITMQPSAKPEAEQRAKENRCDVRHGVTSRWNGRSKYGFGPDEQLVAAGPRHARGEREGCHSCASIGGEAHAGFRNSRQYSKCGGNHGREGGQLRRSRSLEAR